MVRLSLSLRRQKNSGDNPPSSSSTGSRQTESDSVEYHASQPNNLIANPLPLHEKGTKIDSQKEMHSVAVLSDGEHAVGASGDGEIRKWRIRDGKELEMPLAMNAGSCIHDIAVSRDGQWIVSGTKSGLVIVWNAASCEKMIEFKENSHAVLAIDISPDGTKIGTGSSDGTARFWTLSTGKRLLQQKYDAGAVVAAKFSPDGCSLAIAVSMRSQDSDSVRVYGFESSNGNLFLIVSFQITVYPLYNRSLAWSKDSKQLFALSRDGLVHCLDPSNQTALSTWSIQNGNDRKEARCIALESSGSVIATSAGSSVSFWSTETYTRIGSVVTCGHDIWSMAISDMNDLVVCGSNSITVALFCVTPLQTDPIAFLRETVRGLRDELATSLRIVEWQQDSLLTFASSLPAVTYESSSDEFGMNLGEPEQRRRFEFPDASRALDEDNFYNCINSLRAREEHFKFVNYHLGDQVKKYYNKSTSLEKVNKDLLLKLAQAEKSHTSLEHTVQQLSVQLTLDRKKADLAVRISSAHEERLKCESRYSQGYTYDAARSFIELENMLDDDVRANTSIANSLNESAYRYIATLKRIGDEASNAHQQGEAISAYFTALLLRFSTKIFTKWVKEMLIQCSANEILDTALQLKAPRFPIYHIICTTLENDGRLMEAVQCFLRMQDEHGLVQDGRTQWELDFRTRLAKMLEMMGDNAKGAEKHDEAIGHYSAAMKLNPTNLNDILLKQSNEMLKLDPLSHKGYGGRHAALHGMRRFGEAFVAFKAMLSILDQSSDPTLTSLRHGYVDATTAIRDVVQDTIRGMPSVLIDTVSGNLYDKARQATAFEVQPIYHELRSFMTTRDRLDCTRIRQEAKEFYRYVMLSHRWQPPEPDFQTVENLPIYQLPTSPASRKLKNFCKLVHSLGFKWAWSDTCCVNQGDRTVQQESLVAMFRWYRGSSLTIVHLLGVSSDSQVSLRQSIWNTRGWTYQEYLASEVVQFYTEDWQTYRGLQIFNHKESPDILLEMEQAMNFGRKELITLQPGLDRAREKLFLASKRQTTREEDRAYSLFGIFNVAIPVVYGEGNQAIGRLLEHILARSDNVTLLSWTGRSGSHHSYLPFDINAYDQIIPPHIKHAIEIANIDDLVATLYASFPDISQATAMYQEYYSLPPLTLVTGRLRIHCIVFPLTDLVCVRVDSELRTYHGISPMLRGIKIQTRDALADTKGLLIHPWISPLLDLDFSHGEPLFDDVTRALRFFVRLKQPFGVLLVTPVSRALHKRVATDSLIMVQVREETSLSDLMGGIRRIDIQ